MKQMRRVKPKWSSIFHEIRLSLIALARLLVLAAAGMTVLRTALLQNARESGMALARNYAAEERANLSVYETLISFGAVTVSEQIENQTSDQERMAWLERYFSRLKSVLGEGVVTPYMIMEGKVFSVGPWVADPDFDVSRRDWYAQAMEADGQVVFTGVYTDAVSGRPVVTVAMRCGSHDALLAFDIFPEFFRFQFNPLDLETGDSFFLCDGNGGLIYKQTDLTRSDEEIGAYLTQILEKIETGELEDAESYIIDLDGNRRCVYYEKMENGWYSIITVPYSNILGELSHFMLLFGLMIAVFLLLTVMMAWRNLVYSARVERTNETVRVLGNSYYALYRIDLETNTYEMIKGSDYMRGRVPEEGQYEDLLEAMQEVIEPAACEEYARSFSVKNIQSLVVHRIRDYGGDFMRRFGDEYRWVSVRVLFDESLAPQEAVLCFREVEQEKQQQLKERRLLEDALDMARQNEKAKQTFFSNMSHDMRTPLNAIIGRSELAGQHCDEPDKAAAYLNKINYSSRQLLGLINDILDMSRMEQGKIILNNQEFNLEECIRECAETFRFQAEAEKKTLKAELDIKDIHVLGDPFRISQILNNLLSNAMKFTSEGDRIRVSIQQIDQGEVAKYKIEVEDTGIGMSEEYLPHLFEPYSREQRFGTRQALGTGLGMPITKNLVTQMNGEIQVSSRLGEGTVFTIILPLLVGQEEEVISGKDLPGENPEKKTSEEDSGRGKALEGLRILLAEDNEVNMEITTEILSMNGVQVTQAWNGLEAVEAFEKSEPFYFNAILMDMQMPQMDGCQAARKIRAANRPDAGTIPIIAVTANAFAEDVSATTEAGMNAHISKPIDFSHLCRTLERLV